MSIVITGPIFSRLCVEWFKRCSGSLFFVILLGLSVVVSSLSQSALASSCDIPAECKAYGPQVPDCSYAPSIRVPHYPDCSGPIVWVDDTHENGQKITPVSVDEPGRFWGFAALLARDGFTVVESKVPLAQLSPVKAPDILVIANAQSVVGAVEAFTPEEVDAITSWVVQGGSLLLIFDHAPFNGVNSLLSRFELELSPHGVDTQSKNVFRRFDGTLTGSVYASNGARKSDVVDEVITFRGSSFAVSATRTDDVVHTPLLTFAPGTTGVVMGLNLSIAGRLQGVQVELGAGRVIVLAEAAMFTAQISAKGIPTGMHQTKGNEQFLLNIMHWLAGSPM
jgi:hypothetical protein